MAAITIGFQSCSDDDSYDVNGNPKNIVYIPQETGLVKSKANVFSFKLVHTPDGVKGDVFVKFPVRCTKAAKTDVIVYAELDKTLVEAYNKTNGTTYSAFPDGILDLGKAKSSITSGMYASVDSVTIGVDKSKLALLTEQAYLAPIKLATVSSNNFQVSEQFNTVYVIVTTSTVDNSFFTALDMNNPELYSNYIAPDNLAVNLPNYTYEVKCYINAWHNSPSTISRLCSFTSKNEQESNMLRFGESGKPINSLQWVVAGRYFILSNTRFNEGQWYTISLTYDGTKFLMYVDGDKDIEAAGSANCTFQRFELGMSYENYPSNQFFNGRIAEVRVWNRALTTSELKNGLCGVDPKSEGLVAYWKLNDGQGHIFKDATGHGYDMDWSKTYRDDKGNGLNAFDKSTAVNWLTDEKNSCEK